MTGQVDRALGRVLAEIREGLRHGHFEYVLTCELIGHGRRSIFPPPIRTRDERCNYSRRQGQLPTR